LNRPQRRFIGVAACQLAQLKDRNAAAPPKSPNRFEILADNEDAAQADAPTALPDAPADPPASPTHGANHATKRARRHAAKHRRVGHANTSIDLDTSGDVLTLRSARKGPDAAEWQAAENAEFVKLIDESKAMRFIAPDLKPPNRLASYYNPQLRIKIKNGVKQFRIRGTYGGDRSDFTGDVSSQTADLQTIKILLNAAISSGAKFMTADISDFYLGTPLDRKEYMWVSRANIPAATAAKYASSIVWQDNRALVEISKGIYGLPHAGLAAQTRLIAHLATHGYHQCKHTPCLFRHDTRRTAFSLVVDDFGIMYQSVEDAEHLLTCLRALYKITTDWAATKYVGITLNFDYAARSVRLSIPGYVAKALERFKVVKNSRPTNTPCHYVAPRYGVKGAQAPAADDSPLLDAAGKTRIQQIIGVFLFYARAVDPTMLVALGRLSSQQAAPTEATARAAEHFLQYAASWPNASIVYHASDMRLAVDSDASYLSESHARSRVAGHHYLTTNGDNPKPNGAIDVVCSILGTVAASAFEAELGAMFTNGQVAAGIRNTLSDLGFPQQATHINADNETAVNVASGTAKQRSSKAIDMRYHWILDRIRLGQFVVTWAPGITNGADFFTKVHSGNDHKERRKRYVHDDSPTSTCAPP
jgi:hypothetical protein